MLFEWLYKYHKWKEEKNIHGDKGIHIKRSFVCRDPPSPQEGEKKQIISLIHEINIKFWNTSLELQHFLLLIWVFSTNWEQKACTLVTAYIVLIWIMAKKCEIWTMDKKLFTYICHAWMLLENWQVRDCFYVFAKTPAYTRHFRIQILYEDILIFPSVSKSVLTRRSKRHLEW